MTRSILLFLYGLLIVSVTWKYLLSGAALLILYLVILKLIIVLNWAWNFDWLKWMEK